MAHSFERTRSTDTDNAASPWHIYDKLLAGIPDDVCVIDYALGVNWSCLEAECGAGVAYTVSGSTKDKEPGDLRGRPLKEAAALAKSWNYSEATIGIAAMNAWYSQFAQIETLAANLALDFQLPPEGEHKLDAFEVYQPVMQETTRTLPAAERPNVVVIGHFPHVEEIAEYANLIVLERNGRNPFDTPDPACEFVIPDADYVYQTGVTFINKTAPRLLELSHEAHTIIVGPSALPARPLFKAGVQCVAGRIVVDPEQMRFAVNTGERFGSSLTEFVLGRR